MASSIFRIEKNTPQRFSLEGFCLIAKRSISILLILLLSTGPSFSQDSITQQNLNMLNQKVDTVTARQDSLNKKVDRLKDTILAKAISQSFSKSLEEAMKNPEKLYQHTFKDHPIASIVSYIFLGLLLWFSFSYFLNSALCRDGSYNPNCTLKPVKRRPYSYARVQLFWWTMIILFCYILFFALYGKLLALNSTVILLLGSGIAVFIFGKSMDKDQIEKNNNQSPARHQDLYDSGGFLSDILSDENGISIHRLQAVAFNIIYGIGFLSAFFSALNDVADKNYAYPFIEFEPWQLSLLGISAIGYLGLKSTENTLTTRGERIATARQQQNNGVAGPSPANSEEPVERKRDITE